MKTIFTPSKILRYLLAFLCFGMLGAKIANAQLLGSGGCGGSSYSANFLMHLEGQETRGGIYEVNPGTGQLYEGWGSRYGPIGSLGITTTFGFTDGDSGDPRISLPNTPSTSHLISFDLFGSVMDEDTGFPPPAPLGFSFQINSVSVSASAVGDGVLSYDLQLKDANSNWVSITSGDSLGSNFQGYDENDLPDPYNNGPSEDTLRILFYDSGTDVTEFRVDSVSMDITAFATENGETVSYNVCDGTTSPIPEPSVFLLGGLVLGSLALRRSRSERVKT